MPEGENRLLFDAGQIRTAFVASAVGMVGLLVAVLLLATSRPQGSLQPADDSQYRATLLTAAENLEGYELVGEDRARIDIGHAIELVAERGVDLPLAAIGGPAPAAAAPPDDAAPAQDAAAAGDGGDAAPAAQADTAADGEAVYAANCAACHQATGQGIPGAFPPLAGGHAAELAGADGGRDYLIHALLYGVQGPIEVSGATYNGLMPAWQQLSDAQLAAVLNYVTTAWDNADVLADDVAPFTADDVAAARGEGLTGAAVLEKRPDLP
jgi:mono/diheme cytochrome c family protein